MAKAHLPPGRRMHVDLRPYWESKKEVDYKKVRMISARMVLCAAQIRAPLHSQSIRQAALWC